MHGEGDARANDINILIAGFTQNYGELQFIAERIRGLNVRSILRWYVHGVRKINSE